MKIVADSVIMVRGRTGTVSLRILLAHRNVMREELSVGVLQELHIVHIRNWQVVWHPRVFGISFQICAILSSAPVAE